MGTGRATVLVRALGVVLAALVAIRLLVQVVPAQQRSLVIVAAVLVALGGVGVALGLTGRPRMLANRVARLRPGAVVIAAVTTIETRADAQVSGAVDRRWDELGGSPVVLAALPDRIEVWAAGEDRPRWAITCRPEFPPTAVLATMPGAGTVSVQPTPALLCTDGVSRVTVLPVYSSIGATSPQRAQASVERALAELAGPSTM